MRIDEILDERRPVFSFEFFPPKTKQGIAQLKGALEELGQDEPAYVSVTYGAGGSTRDRTVEVTKWFTFTDPDRVLKPRTDRTT